MSIIEYDYYITNEKTQEPLVQELFSKCVRPTPPTISLPQYIPSNFFVEVFEGVCWWTSVVVEEFESPLSKQQFFEISFPLTQTLQAYSHAQLC